MDEGHAGQAQHQETVVGGSDALLVLVAVKQDDDATDETELEDGSSQRWKQETATACECQERAAHHARIDADKCIDVVQLHHQVGGDGKAAEL